MNYHLLLPDSAVSHSGTVAEVIETSLYILQVGIYLTPKGRVKILISTKRYCCFQQGVYTRFHMLHRNLQVCKEELTVKGNSLNKDFSLEKGGNKTWAHLERANS